MLKKFDKIVLIVPTAIVVVLGLVITLLPDGSSTVISAVRNFLGNNIGIYYMIFGIAAFALLLYLAFSRIGKIRIGSEAYENNNMGHFDFYVYNGGRYFVLCFP